jgi:hypothetical protein
MVLNDKVIDYKSLDFYQIEPGSNNYRRGFALTTLYKESPYTDPLDSLGFKRSLKGPGKTLEGFNTVWGDGINPKLREIDIRELAFYCNNSLNFYGTNIYHTNEFMPSQRFSDPSDLSRFGIDPQSALDDHFDPSTMEMVHASQHKSEYRQIYAMRAILDKITYADYLSSGAIQEDDYPVNYLRRSITTSTIDGLQNTQTLTTPKEVDDYFESAAAILLDEAWTHLSNQKANDIIDISNIIPLPPFNESELDLMLHPGAIPSLMRATEKFYREMAERIPDGNTVVIPEIMKSIEEAIHYMNRLIKVYKIKPSDPAYDSMQQLSQFLQQHFQTINSPQERWKYDKKQRRDV